MSRLAGKICIATGASRGIGAEAAAGRHGRIDALFNNAAVIEAIARLGEGDPAA